MKANTIENENSISTKRAIIILVSIIFVLMALGMIIGYFFFWDKPAYESAQDYELKSAVNAVKKHPKDPQLRIELGWVLVQAGQYDRAIQEYKNALKLDPKNVSAKLNIAIAYGEQKQYNKAKKELEKLVEKYPAFTDARVALGSVYYHTKEYDKALKELEFALNANPGTVDYMMMIGNVLEAKGDKKGAIEQYKRAISYIPNYEAAKKALEGLGVKTDSNKSTKAGGK